MGEAPIPKEREWGEEKKDKLPCQGGRTGTKTETKREREGEARVETEGSEENEGAKIRKRP